MNNPEPEIQSRIDELESRLAFQDDVIEALNEVVSRQDRELARLANQLNALSVKFAELAESATGADSAGGHEIPPHY
jgi:SlyX protein